MGGPASGHTKKRVRTQGLSNRLFRLVLFALSVGDLTSDVIHADRDYEAVHVAEDSLVYLIVVGGDADGAIPFLHPHIHDTQWAAC